MGNKEESTEERIIAAARTVFTKKGYAGTRTRDIAEEAGLNLALLNYYFRSKEKLFEIVMAEKVGQLFGIIAPIVNDLDTILEKKVSLIVEIYIKMLSENPGLPLFVLSEIRNNPDQFWNRVQAGKLLTESVLVNQIKEAKPGINPLHFILNILSMTIFPFLVQPVLEASKVLTEKEFETFALERKNMISTWFKAIIGS